MPQDDQDSERPARRRIARKYRSLGYEVLEQPEADLLPDFMRDVAPDLIARGGADNVVIEVKRNASLKGSNDLVRIVALVAGRPDWRVELVALDDDDIDEADDADIDLDGVNEKVTAAIKAGLPDVAYVYLAGIVVSTARDLAEIHRIRSDNKSDHDLFADLALRGIIPPALLQQCLDMLAARDGFVQASGEDNAPEAALQTFLYLCEQLRAGVALSRRHRS
jgi:hypothetical protein